MQIFWRLVLAHFLTDFTLQTNFIASWKRRSYLGGVVHSLIFLITGSLLTFSYLKNEWFFLGKVALSGYVTIVVLTFLHFCEDEWRVWAIERSTGSDSTGFFLWDQFIHLLFIFVCFRPEAAGVTEKWVLLSINLILVVHFIPILLLYLKKDLFHEITTVFKEDYWAMGERTAIFLLLLLPRHLAVAAILLWVAFAVFRVRKSPRTLFWLNEIIGNSLAIIFGLISRSIFYS